MHRYHILQFIGIILFALFISVGCSGSPTSPDTAPDLQQVTPAGQSGNGMHMNLGSYMIELNKNNLTAEVLPLRTSDLHINLTKIFINTMGLSLEVIPAESDPANGEFAINFSLTHPLGGHPEFTAFDIKGIVLSPGDVAVDDVVFSGYGGTRLVDADGYTRWWNPTEFTQPGIFGYTEGLFTNTIAANLTATVNPYKVFADRLTSFGDLYPLHTEPLDSDLGRALFSDGTTNTRKYKLVFPLDPTPVIVFGYVIDGCWFEPSPNPPSEVPDDFPMVANQPEAFDLAFNIDVITLYYDTESDTGGGLCRLGLNIYDWQGLDSGNAAGEIASVEFFMPGLFSGSVPGVFEGEIDGSAVYSADLSSNATPTSTGVFPVIAKVTSAGGPNYDQGLGYPAPADPVAAWQVMNVGIEEIECAADTSNDFNEAITLDTENYNFGKLCAPTDYKDFYEFEFDTCEVVTGTLTLYCDAGPTTLGLYDFTETLIQEETVVGGSATIDISSLALSPNLYYILVYTSNTSQTFSYVLEPDMHVGAAIPPSNAEDVTPPGLNLYSGDLDSYGNYLFNYYYDFQVYDVSDPTDPDCIAKVDFDIDNPGSLEYPHFYYPTEVDTNSWQVGVIDLSDPANPVNYPDVLWFPNEIFCVSGFNGYLFVGLDGEPYDMVRIYDVSFGFDSPVLVHQFLTVDEPEAFHFVLDDAGPSEWFAVEGTYNIIEFLDITDMNNLGPTQVINLGATNIYSADAKNDHLYVVHGVNPVYWLLSIKVDSTGPTLMAAVNFANAGYDLDVEGDYAYLGTSTLDMIIVDLTDPDVPFNPVVHPAGFFQLYDVEASGNYLAASCGPAGFENYSLSDPANPAYINRKTGISLLGDIAFSDNYLYVVQNWVGYRTIKVVDITDPYASEVVEELILTKGCNKIVQNGSRIVAASYDMFLELVDCSDPLNLSTVNTVNNGQNIECMAINNSAVYVGNSTNDINVWNLGTWPAIAISTVVPLPGKPVDILLDGNTMYVTAGPGIEVYSLTDPLNPSFIGTYTPSVSPPTYMDIDGNTLYVTSASSIELVDCTNPGAMSQIGIEILPSVGGGWFVDKDGHFAYVKAYNYSNAYPISICPADFPSILDPVYGVDQNRDCRAMMVRDGIYFEGSSTLLRIFDLHLQ